MKAYQRGMLVVSLAVMVGLVVRLRGKGENPPVEGGWRPLQGPDFR